jgi:hypothetical protein
MRKTRLMAALAASAGLWAGAAGQDVTLHFTRTGRGRAGRDGALGGERELHGVPGPDGVLRRVRRRLPASDPSLGDG